MGFFDGAVVKSNGPASREIRRFVRDSNTGLLVDHSEQFVSSDLTGAELKKELMYRWIVRCEQEGRALTQDSAQDKLEERKHDFDAPEELRALGKESLKDYCQKLKNEGRIGSYARSGMGSSKWLGVPGGPIETATYVPAIDRN